MLGTTTLLDVAGFRPVFLARTIALNYLTNIAVIRGCHGRDGRRYWATLPVPYLSITREYIFVQNVEGTFHLRPL